MKNFIIRKIVHGKYQTFDYLSIWNPLTEDHQFDLVDLPESDGLSFSLAKIFEKHPLYKNSTLQCSFSPFLFNSVVEAKKALDVVKLCYLDNNPMIGYGMFFNDRIESIQYTIVSTETALLEIPKKIVDFKVCYSEVP